MIPLLLCSAIAVQDTTFAETESAAYAVETLNTPEGCVLEVGGMDFLPDGRLVVSTRRGQVWIVDDPLRDDFENAKITLFHEGLWEGLGLDVRDGEIYVLQRGELSKLSDSDGDGRCDVVETITNEWGLSGHYHEFAFGLPRDSAGHWWAGLNVSFGDPEWWHGRSTVPYRGWILRIGADGEVTPWASGVRSPNGVAVDSKDRVLVTDNQGDWIASSPIYHIQKDAFYGHPKSLNWTDEYRASGKLAHDEIPPARAATGRTSPAIWIPYKWSRSTGNLFEDVTDGKFGVPNGQYVVAELTNGMILRAGLEEVQGQLQGWIVPLRTELGSVNRVIQAPDGSVFCGLTNRGWGGAAPADGLRRVRSTGLETMEIAGMTLLDYDEEYEACGFELSFGHPIADGWEPGDETVTAIRYDYDYWWEYGSPERHVTPMENTALQLSDDRTKLVVRSYDLFPAQCVRITLEGVTAASGAPLLHPEIAYTVNQLPSGAPTNAYVAKVVPPPPSKGDADAGVLRLSWGDALGQFEAEGWELCQATLAEDRRSFETSEGNGALVNVGPSATDFVTRGSFGDAHLHVEFMLPEGSRSAIALGDLGRIELTDDAATCGTFRDTAPTTGGYAGAGQWTPLDVYFRRGSADAPAFLDRVELGGTTIHEGVEISGTSGERSPITFVGTAGQIALRNIQVKPPSSGRSSG
ncbi:MAG: family 16 glycoside hydrolase, partial [Planctomycetota bacterium]